MRRSSVSPFLPFLPSPLLPSLFPLLFICFCSSFFSSDQSFPCILMLYVPCFLLSFPPSLLSFVIFSLPHSLLHSLPPSSTSSIILVLSPSPLCVLPPSYVLPTLLPLSLSSPPSSSPCLLIGKGMHGGVTIPVCLSVYLRISFCLSVFCVCWFIYVVCMSLFFHLFICLSI